MSLAKTIEAPSWISTGATITGGLDLLGLRLPVQVIGGGLLDGITSVSPSVRYIAFRCWFIQCYGRSGLADTRDGFAQFSARLEAALVLANLIGDRRTTGLIGSDEALKRLDENPEELAISPLVQTPAATVYAGPSYQLGVTRARDDAVPSLTRERGLPLAESVEQYLSTNSLIKRLLSEPELERVPIDDLRELGAAVRIDEIPDRERELLVTTIVPERPLARERARVGTYASLLLLARNLRKRPTESKYFGAACSMERFGEPLLDDTADGWTAYCVRDSIAVTQEAVLGAVMNEITGEAAGGGTGVRRARIIGPLVERVQDHSEALRDLGLLAASESVGDFSYWRLASRIEEQLREGAVEQANGIVRWPSSLIETRLPPVPI